MNGELLQGINYLCNKGLRNKSKIMLRGSQHPRNLDPPHPACYLPAEAFVFLVFNYGEGGLAHPSPEVT